MVTNSKHFSCLKKYHGDSLSFTEAKVHNMAVFLSFPSKYFYFIFVSLVLLDLLCKSKFKLFALKQMQNFSPYTYRITWRAWQSWLPISSWSALETNAKLDGLKSLIRYTLLFFFGIRIKLSLTLTPGVPGAPGNPGGPLGP